MIACGLPRVQEYAQAIRNCPKRYVIDEELTRMCTALAFSEGDRLESCLDLIHVPTPTMWIEWPDAAHLEEVHRSGLTQSMEADSTHRAGVLLQSDASGRRGEMQTFWTLRSAQEAAFVAPIRVRFDLDATLPPPDPLETVFEGGVIGVSASGFKELAPILACLRLDLHPRWASYYRAAQLNPADRDTVLQASAISVATTLPMLLAFFLMFNARASLAQRHSGLQRLNRARAKCGKAPLLEHTEVSLALSARPDNAAGGGETLRRKPRLHRVRGHLVRRGAVVFWRVPHLRGHRELGIVRSQTLTLRFGQSTIAPKMIPA